MDVMDNHLTELEKSVLAHPQEKLSVPHEDGKWSVIQIMSHLYDSELSILAYIQKKTSSGKDGLKKTTLKSWFNSRTLSLAFKSPFKFKSPEVVANPSNDWVADELFKKWHSWRTDMRQQLLSLDPKFVEMGVFKHPYAGRLNLWQTFDFFKSHFERHHKQIIRILSQYD